MRTITKNKLHKVSFTKGRQVNSICCFCNKNEVPLKDWNKRCSECREKQKQLDEAEIKEIESGIKKREPAAVITTEAGQKIFVDKFGREVDNPGYDLKNDPRGWSKTGILPPDRKLIK